MSNYASAKLQVDLNKENTQEKFDHERAVRERREQEESMSLWSMALGIIGGIFFGPVGYAAGKIVGRELVDAGNMAEAEFINTRGKFNNSEVTLANQNLRDYDKSKDEAK